MFYSITACLSPCYPDGSGDVNAADIDVISKYIMEGNTNGFVFKNADVNGDKKINVADIVEIVKIIKANK